MSLVSLDTPVTVESLASTLQLPSPTTPTVSPPSSPRTTRASRLFSSLRVSTSSSRPSIASLFNKRAPSPPPRLAVDHALPPLPDFGQLAASVPAAVPQASDPSSEPQIAVPDIAPLSLAQIQKALDDKLPNHSVSRAASTASSSSESLSHYSSPDGPVMSVESLNTSFSHVTSPPPSPRHASTTFVINRPVYHLQQVVEEPEPERGRERKRSDASLLRHAASQAFSRTPKLLVTRLKPARSLSFTPSSQTSFPFRGISPHYSTPPQSRSPSVTRSPINIGSNKSASSSQASLSESVAFGARRMRRLISTSTRVSRRRTDLAVTSDESELENDFEMMSPPRDAGWRGMQLYGGLDGLTPPSKVRAQRGRTALIVRLESGNNLDLGLNAFEAVREWAARYGAVSSIQVDSRSRMRRKADSALRVEFRDIQTYERVCPNWEARSLEMRGIGPVVLELVEHK
ncbi:hypothetical protein BKA62DRAFT_667706 [Auriculariales sp. MPI-PUGE-AT-0066]|nr:hypothetical protein BKA62DRAFT_667706 [Auriculariales sp. MPI-PUGE-AT-0066]